MADVVEADLTKGPEVKIYAGGVLQQESKTITTTEAAAGGFVLAGVTGSKADYGLLVGTVNGVKGTFTGHLGATGASAATEAGGMTFVKYSGITAGDLVDIYYVDTSVTALTQVSSCKDIKYDIKASSKKEAVHGQANKITSIGVQETSGSFEMLLVNTAIKALFIGDQVTGSPASGEITWTNKHNGFLDVGVLVGKKVNTSGTVVKKFAMCGIKANSLSKSMPTEDFYKESFGFDADYIIEWSQS